MAIMAAYIILKSEVREHYGLNDDPIPIEVKYEGVLISAESVEKSRAKHLESFIKLDSVLGRRPGRSNQLRELHANRARKELKQIRARQKE